MIKIFLLDNHDSFTYNLASLFNKMPNIKLEIRTPESTNIAKISEFDKIIFSPGPGLPSETPIMTEILSKYKNNKSIFGVCLGHQAIGEYFGAKLEHMEQVNHGMIKHLQFTDKQTKLFKDIPNKNKIGVYHSWHISKTSLPNCLEITGLNEDNRIMSLMHKTLDIQSVQFHPESFITEFGLKMMENWLS